MITHLVDTDWIVDYLKGKEDARRLLSPLIENQSLAASIIVYGEIYEGLLNAGAVESHLRAFADILAGVPILELDVETAQVFACQRAN